jgi:hypothetical protein
MREDVVYVLTDMARVGEKPSKAYCETLMNTALKDGDQKVRTVRTVCSVLTV